ncbi:acyltransferase [Vibrio kasasachensis]|uniref:acyltransferase family protein n=1 Tax=Vibrio kasasachensis TaxID=2910248 RepID=UPI003D1113E3
MRDFDIDILRFIGLAMIVLAHVEPPGFIFQMRNFDVPLMVMISGMSFAISYDNKDSYCSFICKRISRLLLPVWLFLTGYFLLQWLFIPNSDDLNFETIMNSYLLIDGIGYVWIIKVFLLVSIVSPLLYRFHRNTISDSLYFTVIAIIFIVYECIRFVSMPYVDEGLLKSMSLVTHYLVPYAIIFSIGLRLKSIPHKALFTLIIVSGTVFLSICVTLYVLSGSVIPTQELKYPPSIYYCSYAILISCVLFYVIGRYNEYIEFNIFKLIISFCARNSIWIYLWHIPFVRFYNDTFVIKYMVVLTFAIMITYLQVSLVKIISTRLRSERQKRNLKNLLTG